MVIYNSRDPAEDEITSGFHVEKAGHTKISFCLSVDFYKVLDERKKNIMYKVMSCK